MDKLLKYKMLIEVENYLRDKYEDPQMGLGQSFFEKLLEHVGDFCIKEYSKSVQNTSQEDKG